VGGESDDVSRLVQRGLHCYDDDKDYGVKDIGEEGQGGWVFRMICQPHFTNRPTYPFTLPVQFLVLITSTIYVTLHTNSTHSTDTYLNG